MNAKKFDEFEHVYEQEYARFVEENKYDTVWNTVQKYPAKCLVMASLAFLSIKQLVTAVQSLQQQELWVALLVGYFLADFLTGLIHLVCDNTPLSLKTIKDGRSPLEWAAYGFHYHHVNPTDWNHNNIFFGGIVRAGFIFYVPMTSLTLWLVKSHFWQAVLYVTCHTGLLAQYSHAASHGRYKGNKVIQFLQNHYIILHPSIHKIHHREFNQNYAILNGSSNFLLNMIYNYLVKPYYATDSVSAETQKQLYYEKQVKRNNGSTFQVKSIPPQFVIFPDYRKHKGCPI